MIAAALLKVRSQLEKVAEEVGRNKSSIRLVAVSKFQPVESILQAYEVGQRVFGENYVNELCEKAPLLPDDIEWHMIGTVQTNKIKQLVKIPNLKCVESVSTEKCAKILNEKWGEINKEKKLEVFIQVNTSGEESKDGLEPGECRGLVEYVLFKCPNLSFRGLMTIGKLGDSTSPEYFQTLSSLKKELISITELKLTADLIELSMGMSGDFELAIKCGATNVRIGSTIFGSRPQAKPATVSKEEEEAIKNN